ncbi:FecR/PupR family sigma factor regulator [Pseudomonas sp. S37]|uniref:FecR/PupR family sigma factor regulator n=1 Tax=Pseudomonas sp. S37 TaxID=2767449 RepID=UPI001912CE5C|nr:DUF4880 domain-containing protein [Pseudomonas sp. S37]
MSDARHQAARWFTRLLELPAEHPERNRFAQWLAADPRHAEEYQAFAALWEGFARRPRRWRGRLKASGGGGCWLAACHEMTG